MAALRARLVDSLRAFAGRRRLLPLTALLLRAATVRPAPAFVARELLRRRRAATYRLRGSSVRVIVRHSTPDVVTLGEVFHDHQYVPPAPVVQALATRDGPAEVLDLGGNVGLFGAFCLSRWPRARITAFEPDPENAAVLESCVAANGRGDRWRVVRAAAATRSGEAEFVSGLSSLSHLAADAVGARGEPSLRVPTEDVLPRMAASDLVKVDIEGGEWALLRDPRFREQSPPVLVLEYHPHPTLERSPREEVERLLAGAGLEFEPIFHRDDGYGMLWAWRP
jgi:FkbM family methyltransferase